jgi:hypothetical protein
MNSDKYFIVFIHTNGDYEHIATVFGSNSEKRANEYAKQILAPNKAEVIVVHETDFYLITAQL